MTAVDRHQPVRTSDQRSLATAQVSLADPTVSYPLWPPLTAGCPTTSTSDVAMPLEVEFDYDAVPAELFERDQPPGDLHGWAPLLPPLHDALRLGVGATPLVELPAESTDGLTVFAKDESRNPTWSHKDRLNVCAVSAAALVGAPGVVVASSGNHGASAAAMSARLGLPCVVIASAGTPPAVNSFLAAYGATVLVVPREARWTVLSDLVTRLGLHPVSNLTGTHTGHPFGPEGYKTIAYELFLQLGRRVPAAVFVPTGYGELLFGVWKGFDELRRLNLASKVPRLYSCEPEARAPLATALERGLPAVTVAASPTDAYAIGTTTSGYRGVLAIRRSAGAALRVSDEQMSTAASALAREGLWQEMSAAAALAGLRHLTADQADFDGPVVCICTSSGFKDRHVGEIDLPTIDPGWPAIRRALVSGPAPLQISG